MLSTKEEKNFKSIFQKIFEYKKVRVIEEHLYLV